MLNKLKESLPDKFAGLLFIDSFLDYRDKRSDNRFYHMLKADICQKFINKNASSEKVFLDAGAGRGPYTEIARKKYRRIYCFEYNQNELNRAIKNINNNDRSVIFKQVDITNIPLDNSTIDVAVCSEVLEHIQNYQKAMSEIYRVMIPGGVVLFSMPNNLSLLYAFSRIKNRKLLLTTEAELIKLGRWEQMRHLMFSYKQIEQIAVSSGFKIINRRGLIC